MCYYLLHQAFMAHIVWYNENMKKKQHSLIQRLKLSKIMNLLHMLIFIWWNSDACDVNQGDVYNSTADTDIKWSKYLQ